MEKLSALLALWECELPHKGPAWWIHKRLVMQGIAQKTKGCQFDNFVIIGGILSYCNENLWCISDDKVVQFKIFCF